MTTSICTTACGQLTARRRPVHLRLWSAPLALLLLLLIGLAGCAAGNDSSQALAFVRNGTLYTMQPTGSNLFMVSVPTVANFAWSPDHHQFVVRYLATAPLPPVTNALTDSFGDTGSAYGVISIEGGALMTVTPQPLNRIRSDPYWNARGNRLIYREREGSHIFWYQAQADQPNGIARKLIASTSVIPATADDGSTVAALSADGNLMVGAPQQAPQPLQSGASVVLANNMPARVLWRPGHPQILYPVSEGDQFVLYLTDLAGKKQMLFGSVDLRQYSWSPDGSFILARTGSGYSIYRLKDGQQVSWDDTTDSLPWWSPDSRQILTRSADTLAIIVVASGKRTELAHLPALPVSTDAVAPDAWHPITGSPWSPDSQRFALVSNGGRWRNGDALSVRQGTGTGLYIIPAKAIPTTAPNLVEWGEHRALSWQSVNPNTQFLTP